MTSSQRAWCQKVNRPYRSAADPVTAPHRLGQTHTLKHECASVPMVAAGLRLVSRVVKVYLKGPNLHTVLSHWPVRQHSIKRLLPWECHHVWNGTKKSHTAYLHYKQTQLWRTQMALELHRVGLFPNPAIRPTLETHVPYWVDVKQHLIILPPASDCLRLSKSLRITLSAGELTDGQQLAHKTPIWPEPNTKWYHTHTHTAE